MNMNSILKMPEDFLIDFDGDYYYIDIDTLEEEITVKEESKYTETITEIKDSDGKVKETTTTKTTKDKHHNIFKSDLYTQLITIVFNMNLIGEEVEMTEVEKMQNETNDFDNADISVKIAFNTLLVKGIIKKI